MNILTKTLVSGLAAAAVALPAFYAQAADKITMQLNWFQLADHSPLYLAKVKGYYADEGIDIKIIRGQGSGDAAKKIDLKQAEFGMADIPTVLTAISKGADIVIIGVVYDKAANNLFFRKSSGIDTVKDLSGKKVAAPPADAHRTLWPVLAAAHDVDPESVTFVNIKPEGKQAILVSEQVDGVFDLYTNLPMWEKVIGKGKVGNLLFADNGVSLYGHGYITHRDTVKNNPELVRRFLSATYKGWQSAYSEREAAIDALMVDVDGVDKAAYLINLDMSMKLIITERSKKHGLGWIEPDAMRQTIEIASKGGKFGDTPLTLETVFTNDFNSKIPAPN